MSYIQATKEQCEAYDELVSTGLGFPNSNKTLNWMTPVERNGDFYIQLHADFPAFEGCEVVESLPVIDEEE